MRREALWIDGEWVPSQAGETFSTIDPATGEVLAEAYASKKCC